MRISKPKRLHRILGLCNNNKLTLIFPDVWCPGLFFRYCSAFLATTEGGIKLELHVGSSDTSDPQQHVGNFTLHFPGTQTQEGERTSIPSPLGT